MSTVNFAQLLYDAYPDTDLLSIDPKVDLTDLDVLLKCDRFLQNDGAPLFQAILYELHDATHYEPECYQLPNAIRALETQRDTIQKVIDALRAAAPAA